MLECFLISHLNWKWLLQNLMLWLRLLKVKMVAQTPAQRKALQRARRKAGFRVGEVPKGRPSIFKGNCCISFYNRRDVFFSEAMTNSERASRCNMEKQIEKAELLELLQESDSEQEYMDKLEEERAQLLEGTFIRHDDQSYSDLKSIYGTQILSGQFAFFLSFRFQI